MNALIQKHLGEIQALCANTGVAELFVFGSVNTSHFNLASDVDFAVVFQDSLSPLERGDAFFRLMESLEKLLNRKVDLVSYSVIKNPIFKQEVDSTKVSLYAAA